MLSKEDKDNLTILFPRIKYESFFFKDLLKRKYIYVTHDRLACLTKKGIKAFINEVLTDKERRALVTLHYNDADRKEVLAAKVLSDFSVLNNLRFWYLVELNFHKNLATPYVKLTFEHNELAYLAENIKGAKMVYSKKRGL